jgi:type II secretory pathway pseudopilin PulG
MEEDYSFEEMVPEEPSNRSFTLIAIGLVAIVIITIAGIALWMFVLSPAQQEARDMEATETAVALTQSAMPQVPTETFTPWPSNTPQPTSPPTATQTVEAPAQASTETATITPGSTATFTHTPTALPDTGFADGINLPGLVMLGLILVLIAFAARQIRVNLTN